MLCYGRDKTSQVLFSCTHFKARCVYVHILLTVFPTLCVLQHICIFTSVGKHRLKTRAPEPAAAVHTSVSGAWQAKEGDHKAKVTLGCIK